MAIYESFISVAVSQDLRQKLLHYQTEKGLKSVSEAIALVLAERFGLEPESSQYASQKRVEELEAQMRVLADQVQRLTQLVARYPVVRSPALSSAKLQEPDALLKAEDVEEEDIEDEPDEILYDFLQ